MSIDEVISKYTAAKAAEAAAKKDAAALKALILQHAAGRLSFDTDVYNVIIKETSSVRLDTEALYADFPDIKETYGRQTISQTIAAAEKAAARKTA